METKHTKGEWQVDRRALLRVCVNDMTIANCGGAVSNDSLEEAQANAKLIAAAPELLEALVGLRSFINELTFDYPGDELIIMVDNAIKKATE